MKLGKVCALGLILLKYVTASCVEHIGLFLVNLVVWHYWEDNVADVTQNCLLHSHCHLPVFIWKCMHDLYLLLKSSILLLAAWLVARK